MQRSADPRSPAVAAAWVAASLALGGVAGWLDVGATEVQGTVLLLMAAAFAVALLSRVPVWGVAAAVAAGLPAAHLAAHAARGGGGAQWGMVIALLPTLVAALAGRGVRSAFWQTADALLPAPPRAAESRRESSRESRAASPAALLGAAVVGCAVVGWAAVYATLVARAQPFAWWVATWWQLATLVAWAAAAPAVLRAWRATRSASRAGGAGRGPTAPELAAHAAAVAAGAAVHALAMPLATRALFVPLGPAGVAGAAAWAFAAYLPLDALAYALVVGLGHASDAGRRARAAALRESAVRGELATARLAELRAQLRPHFLFNALNAATVLARRGDAGGAARVLGGLAELLRYVLGPAGSAAEAAAQLVPLDDELAFAGAYLAVERERFPERLRPAVDATAEARAALVPHLLLQPLVENAVQHGVGARLGAGLVTVRAWRDGAVLRVVVEDDGPGPAPAAAGGVGLANTRARLRTLYGDAATLTLAARPGGGAVASVALPYAARGGAP